MKTTEISFAHTNPRPTRASIVRFAIIIALAGFATARAASPYTNDAYTVLLDHFDGSTLASINGYQGSSGACGSAWPSGPASFGFTSGPEGLGAAAELRHPSAPPASATYLRYSGELLSRPQGTLEFWVYLYSSLPAGGSFVDQGPYYGACGGWTFGMGVDTNYVLSASAWDAFNLNSGTNRVTPGRYHHIAVTWGSAGARLYLNGLQVGFDASTNAPAAGFSGNLLLQVGTHQPSFRSRLDELRISSVQRTLFQSSPPLVVTDAATYAGFTLVGPAGAQCRIEWAPTFGDTNAWSLLTNVVLSAGPTLFVDPASRSHRQRYYRSSLLGP